MRVAAKTDLENMMVVVGSEASPKEMFLAMRKLADPFVDDQGSYTTIESRAA